MDYNRLVDYENIKISFANVKTTVKIMSIQKDSIARDFQVNYIVKI